MWRDIYDALNEWVFSFGDKRFTHGVMGAFLLLVDGLFCLPWLALRGKAVKAGRMVMNTLSLACVVAVAAYTVTTG